MQSLPLFYSPKAVRHQAQVKWWSGEAIQGSADEWPLGDENDTFAYHICSPQSLHHPQPAVSSTAIYMPINFISSPQDLHLVIEFADIFIQKSLGSKLSKLGKKIVICNLINMKIAILRCL